jgi:hypothetical protein
MKAAENPGRILRIKHGFNPNSSSIGSIIFALPVSLMAATVGFSVISGLVLQYFIRKPPDTPAKIGEATGLEKETAGENQHHH